MPYPYEIDTAEGIWTGLNWPSGVRIGPFQYGSKLFAVFSDNATTDMEIWESSDAGATWTESDSANKPADMWFYSYPAFHRDDAIWVPYQAQPSAFSFETRVTRFSLSRGEYLPQVTGGPSISVDYGNVSLHVPYGNPLVVRSDGSLLYVYPHNEGGGFVKAAYKTYDGTTWSSRTLFVPTVSEYQGIAGILLGSADVVHLFYQNATYTAAVNDQLKNLKHICVEVDGTLSTPATITSNLELYSSTSQGYCTGAPVRWFDGTNWKIAIPFSDSSEDVKIAVSTDSTTPSWTIETVSLTNEANVVANANKHSISLCSYGQNLYCIWVSSDAPSSTNIYYNSRVAGVWGTETLHRTVGSAIEGMCANTITDGIGIIFGGGETPTTGIYYDFIDLSGAGATPEGAFYGFV